MSTRRRHNGPDTYASGSGSKISGCVSTPSERPCAFSFSVILRALSELTLCLGTLLLIFCFAKCIFDVVRSRNDTVYETDTTESERSFEPYIPRRERRERRNRQNPQRSAYRAESSAETILEEEWRRDYVPPIVLRSQVQMPTSTHAGSRLRGVSPSRPATGLPGRLECQICFDEKSREDFPSRRMTKKCKHEATDCCNTCLAQAISTAFEGNIWDDIRCPICNEQLEFQDMAELAPRNIFER